MMALLVEAGERWALDFERIARIADDEKLRPYAFPVGELDGLLPVDEGLLPVWRPREFAGCGNVVVVYFGDEGIAGLHVTHVLGIRSVEGVSVAHGEWLPLEDGQRARWFDFDVLERRLREPAVSGGLNA